MRRANCLDQLLDSRVGGVGDRSLLLRYGDIGRLSVP